MKYGMSIKKIDQVVSPAARRVAEGEATDVDTVLVFLFEAYVALLKERGKT